MCIRDSGSTDCPRPSRVYSCTRPGLSASVGQVCDGQICVGDQCQDVGDTADGDFIDAILQLEIGRQLSVYGDTKDVYKRQPPTRPSGS